MHSRDVSFGGGAIWSELQHPLAYPKSVTIEARLVRERCLRLDGKLAVQASPVLRIHREFYDFLHGALRIILATLGSAGDPTQQTIDRMAAYPFAR